MKHMSMWIICILFIVITYIWMKFYFFIFFTSINWEFGEYSTAIPSTGNFIFPLQYLICISITPFMLVFLHSMSLTFYCFLLSWKIIYILPTFHWNKTLKLSIIIQERGGKHSDGVGGQLNSEKLILLLWHKSAIAQKRVFKIPPSILTKHPIISI